MRHVTNLYAQLSLLSYIEWGMTSSDTSYSWAHIGCGVWCHETCYKAVYASQFTVSHRVRDDVTWHIIKLSSYRVWRMTLWECHKAVYTSQFAISHKVRYDVIRHVIQLSSYRVWHMMSWECHKAVYTSQFTVLRRVRYDVTRHIIKLSSYRKWHDVMRHVIKLCMQVSYGLT